VRPQRPSSAQMVFYRESRLDGAPLIARDLE
jgi:hypothetical protein